MELPLENCSLPLVAIALSRRASEEQSLGGICF